MAEEIEERKKRKGKAPNDDDPSAGHIWSFDIDSTITAAPAQFARLATALQALGDKIVCVTGHGPVSTRKELLDTLGFPYDEIIVVDPKDDGSGKAKILKKIGAWFHFDDRIEFGPEIIKICPVTFQFVEPPGDKKDKKDAEEAGDKLKGKRSVIFVGGPFDGETRTVSGFTKILTVGTAGSSATYHLEGSEATYVATA